MVFNSWLDVVLLFWGLALAAWIIYREISFRRFFANARKTDIRTLLESLLKAIEESKKETGEIEKLLQDIRKKDLGHIQKIGLVRFNPFRDAGGNQSFAFALLDAQSSGIVLTGLHARETTRIYVKEIIKGASRSELSKEERQAVEQAIK